ncbi:MAG: extracellular solute-binding protein, partial [Devosia sp.]|nr:extracellular solute-binding protein [Devosia sp.]
MLRNRLGRRGLLVSAAAIGGATVLPGVAFAKGSVTAAIYPGTWEEAYRAIVAPALKKKDNIDLEMQPLFAVDQIAKARAARGAPPFDTFVLDPGPRITGIDGGLFEKFDPAKLTNAGKLPAGLADGWGVCVGAQVVGIAYNPKKLPAPKGWKDLFTEPFVSRLGLTGFQTTFGTVSLIEIAKAFGGSETNVEPALVELKKVLPKIAAVGQPAAMPSLFQQGQCDVMYTNTQTVATLKGRGVDIEFVKPESGAIAFYTTMHIAKGAADAANAYKYFDVVVSKEIQEALT